jgi:cytidylate kinase
MANILNKIINEQIKAWEHANSGKKKIIPPTEDPLPIITISREFGALGATLAVLMGEKIGFKVWDQNILSVMAEQLGSNEKTVEELDESHRELIEDMVAGFMKNVNTNVSYLRSLKKVIKTIEARGNAIIVGRGANYICSKPSSLHVRIVSPLEKRVVNYAKRKGIDKEEALSIIQRTDAEREAFVQYYFKKDISKSADYDLILNSGTYSLAEMMDMVVQAYKHKTKHKLRILN